MTATFFPAGSACAYCASRAVKSFVPARVADRAAILLCMRCERLTILTPHGTEAWLGAGRPPTTPTAPVPAAPLEPVAARAA